MKLSKSVLKWIRLDLKIKIKASGLAMCNAGILCPNLHAVDK